MKRLISTVSAAVLLGGAMLLPGVLRAHDGKDEAKPGAHEPGGDHEGQWKEKLGITDDQEAKLKTLKRAHRDAEESARTEIGASMRKLKDQLEDKAPEKDLTATLDKIQASHKAMQAEQEKFMTGMAAILTPTQRAKMLIGMMGHMQRHGGMGGPGGGMRGPGGKPQHGDGGEHEDKPDHDGDD